MKRNFLLWSQKVKNETNLLLLLAADDWPAVPVARTINIRVSAFLRVTAPILRCAARGAREWGIIWRNTILLTWPPMYSWLAKAIKWLAISSALVSHPMSLSPCNRIRMSGLDLCITGISRRTKSPIVLPPFPNIRTRAVASNLKQGRILASVPACLSTCQRLQHEWPQTIAERTIPTVLPYPWTTKVWEEYETAHLRRCGS